MASVNRLKRAWAEGHPAFGLWSAIPDSFRSSRSSAPTSTTPPWCGAAERAVDDHAGPRRGRPGDYAHLVNEAAQVVAVLRFPPWDAAEPGEVRIGCRARRTASGTTG